MIISASSNRESKFTYGIFIIVFFNCKFKYYLSKILLKKMNKSNYDKVFIEHNINNQKIYILNEENFHIQKFV